MRVVLDTNMFISKLLGDNTLGGRCYAAWLRGDFTLISSEWQIRELRGVTKRPRLKARIPSAQVGTMVNLIRKNAVMVTVKAVNVSADPDDNPIFSMAFEGQAQYIVSADDEHVLIVKKARGVRTIHPKAFLETLE